MTDDVLGWVIEAGPQPIYWDGRAVDSFTENHDEAVRFARFEDAERVRCTLLPPKQGRLCKSVQHGWDWVAPPGAPTRGEEPSAKREVEIRCEAIDADGFRCARVQGHSDEHRVSDLRPWRGAKIRGEEPSRHE